MDKLREQIAKIICRSKCLAHNDNCQCSTGAADAILALLQPRMLTKDEAETLQVCFENESGRRYGKVNQAAPILTKLKLIQEEAK